MTSNTGAGHIGPLVPFAHAFLDAGHDVLLAAPAKARPTVERAELPFFPLSDPPAEETDAIFAELPSLPQEEQSVRVMREIFAGIDARTSLHGVLRAVGRFRPDVLLREPTEYAGLLAAERLGVRHGRIAIMAAASETWGVPVVTSVLDEHRKRLVLRPDPEGRRITESPYLTVIPEALEDPDDFGPVHAVRFREPRPEPRPLPNWWPRDERPLVYATYGSVTPTLPFFPALFRATVAALGELPVRALFTVGVDVDVDPLGPVPANVRIERWIPQADVMPARRRDDRPRRRGLDPDGADRGRALGDRPRLRRPVPQRRARRSAGRGPAGRAGGPRQRAPARARGALTPRGGGPRRRRGGPAPARRRGARRARRLARGPPGGVIRPVRAASSASR